MRYDDPSFESHKQSIYGQWQTMLQLTAVYYAAILWFKDCVIGVWEDLLAYKYLGVYEYLTASGLLPTQSLPEDARWPAILAVAAVHTGLALIGVIIGNTLKRLRSIALGSTVGVVATLSFTVACYSGMVYCFEHGEIGVRHIARAFNFPVDIDNASHYFGIVSSTSMTLWVGVAMAFASFDKEDVGIAPSVVSRYLPRIALFYVMSISFFRFGCVPLWNYAARFSYLALGSSQEAMIADLDSFSKLASGTHTLTMILGIAMCSTTNKLLFSLPCNTCDPNTSATSWHLSVLFVLVAMFCVIFWQWVAFAVEHRVQHVIAFAEIFAGKASVEDARELSWSPVHSLVMTSYLSWFVFGILFEQTWEGSESNKMKLERIGTIQKKSPAGVISFIALCALVVFVVIPVAYAGGFIGFLVFCYIMIPCSLPTTNRKLPTAPPGDYLNASWEKATADCPRTGGSYLVIGVGFVGKRLITKLLERGETHVKAFDISPNNPFEDDARVHYIRGDVTSPDDVRQALEGVDTVITTFAAIRFWERLSFQRAFSVKVNVKGTENVLKQCKAMGVKRLVYTSTSHVMATPKLMKLNKGKAFDEESPLATEENSHNHYTWTKAVAETMVRKASCPEFLTACCRPCSGVFGPGDHDMSARWIGLRIVPIPFDMTLDWVYVDDVVLGLLKAEARLQEKDMSVAGEAFNITGGEPRTYYDMTQGFQRVFGRPGVFALPAPTRIMWMVAYIVEAVHWVTKGRITLRSLGLDIVTPACLHTGSLSFWCDGSKAKRLLNYQPHLTVDQAIQLTCAITKKEKKD